MRNLVLALLLVTACSSADEPKQNAIDGNDVLSFRLGGMYCGGRPTGCAAFDLVDLEQARIERHRCVEIPDAGDSDAGTDAGVTRYDPTGPTESVEVATAPLSPSEIAGLRQALSRIRWVEADWQNHDGGMEWILITTRRSGEIALSPEAMCGHGIYEKVIAGLEDVHAAMPR